MFVLTEAEWWVQGLGGCRDVSGCRVVWGEDWGRRG